MLFTLVIGVRPIEVRFQNRFCVYQIKGFSQFSSKFFFKKINLRMRYLALKIAVVLVFEKDDISSSKSYTARKSEISPQGKLGSLRNLKLKFTRH